jgi:amino acid adenylation domain-containing protein
LLIPKSPIAIVATFAVLKAGAIYVPIDPAMPATRALKIVKKSGARWVLAAGAVQKLLNEVFADAEVRPHVTLAWLDAQPVADLAVTPRITVGHVSACPSSPVNYHHRSHDPAHILFTSGSTGEPKGVVITHDNVMQFVKWGVRYFNITPGDRNSGQTPLHFDLSSFDIYGTLTAGAELHIVPPEVALLPHKLTAFMRESELSQWFSVPSLLNYVAKFDALRDNDCPRMKRLLWCGEVLPTPTLIYWMQKLPHVTFTNLYGPTEATIASSYYSIPCCPKSPEQAIPIGTACDGETLYVLDEQLRPVPRGVVGDLYIGGVGLSPGYWEDAERTAAAFIPVQLEGRQQRIYKTGDLASVRDDGLLYFHGRADYQIKSRGYRIELGEIEVALNGIGSLVEVAVVGAKTDNFEGTVICCAYVAAADTQVSPTMLRKKLSERLPPYMLPTRWQAYEALPKNVNGKIDRRRLQEEFETSVATQKPET